MTTENSNTEKQLPGIWEILIATGESLWSEGYYKLLGISFDVKPSTKQAYKNIHPDDRQTMVEAFRNAVETRDSFFLELKLLKPDESTIDVEVSGRILLKDNKPWKLVVSFTPYVENKIVQQIATETINSGKEEPEETGDNEIPEVVVEVSENDEMEESDSVFNHTIFEEADQLLKALDMIQKTGEKLVEYETVIESSQSIISVISKSYKYLLVNRAFAEFYGVDKTQAIGKNTEDIIGKERFKKDFLPHLTKCFEGEKLYSEVSYEIKGKTKYYDFNYTPIINKSNLVEKVILSGRNVTQRKKAELDLLESRENYKTLSDELSESNQLKELLLDILSHDLKNSAWLINNIADMLAGDEPLNKDYQMLNKATHKLINIINNTSVLSRISVGDEIETTQLNITSLIKSIITDFDEIAKEKGVSIEMDYDLPVMVNVNPIISEVFRNYIDNAIKYGSKGKKIDIELTRDEPLVIIKVIDYGDTIDEEQRVVIFERTKRLDNDSSRGTGLGLSIVKKIADAHNADVWVEQNSPNGNIFCLSIKQ